MEDGGDQLFAYGPWGFRAGTGMCRPDRAPEAMQPTQGSALLRPGLVWVAPEGLKARHQEPSPVFALGTRTALEGLKAGQIPAQGSARFALGARVAPAGLKTGKGSSWTFPEHGGNPRGLGLQLGTWHYS